jgi:hypothetical protein
MRGMTSFEMFMFVQKSDQKRFNHANLLSVKNSSSRKRQIIKKLIRRR